MKKLLQTFLITVGLLMPFASLAKDYDVILKNVSAETAINILKKETGYDFVYQKPLLRNITQRFSGHYTAQNVESLLDDIIGKRMGLDYEIVDKNVILREAGTKSSAFTSRTINGVVRDENDEVLPGAYINVKGTDIAAVTNIDGAFSIEVTKEHPEIEVYFFGMKPYKVKITAATKSPLNITLDTNYSILDEVVVTGYQNLKRENATGAYQVISSKDMERRFTNTVAENLEGKVPGLVTNTQEDGENAIVIRGVGTLNAKTSPLVVVDGLPIEGGLETVNPYDIANITVLKDAAAASIYGARASNGVIVITTKQAKSERISIDFNTDITISEKRDYSNFGWASAADIVELEKYNFDYMKICPDQLAMDGLISTYNSRKQQLTSVIRTLMSNYMGDMSDSEMNSALARYASSDYRKEYQDAFETNRLIQQYNLGIRVPGKTLSSSIVLNYKRDNLGLQRESNNALTFKYRGDLKAAKWLDVSLGVNVISERAKSHVERPFINSYSPVMSMYNADGSLADMTEGIYDTLDAMHNPDFGLKSLWYNPIDEMDMAVQNTRRTNIRTYVQATAKILPGWNVSGHFQYEDIYYKSNAYREASTYAMRELYNLYTGRTVVMVDEFDEDWNIITVPRETIVHNIPDGGRLDQLTSEGAYYTFRLQTHFNRILWGMHSIDVLGGFEYRDLHDKTSSNVYLGYDDQTQQNSNAFVNYRDLVNLQGSASIMGDIYRMYGAPDATNFATSDILHRYYSLYFTGNYVYDSRYALSGSWRIDKTDLFGTDPKFRGRPLWSIGASWNMHNEPFLHDQEWISALKPRISYGLTGNIDSSVSSYLVASLAQNTINGSNMANLETPPNDKLRWEKTATWNAGLDFAFWNFRLAGTIDYYHKKGTDLLASTDLDPTTGWNSLTINNASTLNQGIELQLTGRILEQTSRNSLGITATANFSYNKNKVLKVNHKAATGYENLMSYTFHEGYPVHGLFSYDFAGLQVDDNGMQYFTWRDHNGEVHNSEITLDSFTPEDVVYSGSLDPKYVGSFTPEISYGGFSLSAMMSYYGGHVMRVNTDEWTCEGSQYGYGSTSFIDAIPASYLNFWRTGDATKYPANGYPGENVVGKFYGKFGNTNVVPADYLKVRNIVLTYEFDSRLTRKIGIQQARLRFQMNNVATWARNKHGKDPEAVNAYNGSNLTRAPRSYTFSLFLNL